MSEKREEEKRKRNEILRLAILKDLRLTNDTPRTNYTRQRAAKILPVVLASYLKRGANIAYPGTAADNLFKYIELLARHEAPGSVAETQQAIEYVIGVFIKAKDKQKPDREILFDQAFLILKATHPVYSGIA